MTSYNDWATFSPCLLDAEYGLDLTALTVLALRVSFVSDDGPGHAIEPINAVAWAVRQCTATLVSLTLVCPNEGMCIYIVFGSKDLMLTPFSLIQSHGRTFVCGLWRNATPSYSVPTRDAMDGSDPRHA